MPPTTFAGLVNVILGLINIVIPLIFGLLFVFLVWKIFNSWVLNAADEGAREEGRQYAVVAVIVFVVMVVAWGIVAMLRTSLFGI
jgi:hypothetical protein